MTGSAGRPISEHQRKPEASLWKDYFVLLPLLGAACAVFFDVGYFSAIDINLFTLFSLSEHILFALEPLPLLFIVSSLPIIYYAQQPIATYFVRRLSSQLDGKRRQISAIPQFLAWIAYAIFLVAPILAMSFPRWGLLLFIGSYWLGCALCLPIAAKESRRALFFIVGSLLMLTDFGMGYAIAKSYTRKGGSALHVIEGEKSSFDATRIIRSGERGLLFYDIASDRIRFLKWDSIKSISHALERKAQEN